jgi:hypothetical protein
MYRGIIGLVTGEPDGGISRHRGPSVAVEGERITSFADGQLVAGKAAGRHTTDREVPEVGESYITTVREEQSREVYTEFLADLPGGWVTIDTADAEFLWHWLSVEHGVEIDRAEINVDALAAEIRDWERADVWQSQTNWGDTVAEGVGGGVTIAYHDDASWPTDGRTGQLGFGGTWDGVPMRGVVARSGYLALFTGGTDENAGRFITDVVLEHCSVPDDEQATFGGGEV